MSGRPGRASKLTADVAEKIITVVRAGNLRETAAAAGGITTNTMRNWLRRGASGEEPYASFSEALDIAEAEVETTTVGVIEKAAKAGDWKAAAYLLENRGPRRWSRTTRLEHTGKDGGPIELDSKTELFARLDRLRASEAPQVETGTDPKRLGPAGT
jgi:hypothetical protein